MTHRSPRAVLARYHQAMLDRSADDLADLYAVDARHDFPFPVPGWPLCYQGRDEVRAGYRAAWAGHPVTLTEIHDVAVYDGVDSEVIIGEWAASGLAVGTNEPASFGGLLILRVRAGQIAHARDYMNVYGVVQTLGRLPGQIAG